MKKAYRHFCKYVNGARGIISILLCLVLCPFLSISFLLVESSRYQQAIQTLDEVNNNAAMSTLADKDSYLFERFGLFGTSQEGSIDAKYQSYLQKNWGVLGAGAKLNSAIVNLNYSLSLNNPDVLQKEILEFSELNVSTQMVADYLDLDKLISTLESLGDLKKIRKSIEAISAGADAAAAAVDLVKNADTLLTSLNSYAGKYNTYVLTHSEFLKAALDLQATIKTEMDADDSLCYPKDLPQAPTPSPDGTTPAPSEEKTSVYDNDNVKAKITELNKKVDAYQTACDDLAANLDEITSSIKSVYDNLKTVKEKIDKIKELGEEDKDSKTGAVSSSAEQSAKVYDDIFASYTDVFTDFEANNGIEELEKDVQKIKETSSSLQDFDVETITGETTTDDLEAVYAVISILVPDSNALTEARDDANTSLGGDDGGKSILSIVGDMVDSVRKLLNLNGVYDTSLNAYISSDYMASLQASNGSAPGYAQQILDSMKTMLIAVDQFKSALEHWDLLGVLNAIVTVLRAVVEFYNGIFNFFEQVCSRVYELISGGLDKAYESLLVCGYCAYDFPNRTNKSKSAETLEGSALTGGSYADIARAQSAASSDGTHWETGLEGLLKLLKNLQNESSEDITFCGAELEYILIGTQSEIMNQAGAFIYVYLLRMIMDILPICASPDVATLAAETTVGAPVVYALEFLLEPLCDTIILVNGGTSYIYKTTIYMTPTGLEKLVKALLNATALTDIFNIGESEDKTGSTPKETGGTLADFISDGILEVDYKDHLLFMLMFTCTQAGEILPRVQHLIQMETESYYKKQVADYTFNLSKSYVYLNFNLDVTLDPLFSIGSLSKTGYPYQKSVYRGY